MGGCLEVKLFFGGIYICLACICIASSALANSTLSDPSLFIPVSNAVNLTMNCLAGLFIWEDADRLVYPWMYGTVFGCVLFGTYLISTGGIAGRPRNGSELLVSSHLG